MSQLVTRHRAYLYTLVVLTVSLVLSMTIFQLLLGISNVAIWVGSGGSDQLIVGVGARTLFSSRVPEILYENLALDDDVTEVYPVVIGIVVLNGNPVIVKGFNLRDIERIYGDYMSSGVIEGGVSALIGYKLAEFFGLSVGDSLYISSVNKRSTYILKVSGIYSTGSLMDYEIVLDIELAREIVGLSDDYVSYIAYEGSELNPKLKEIYSVDVKLPNNISGKLAIYNVVGELVKEVVLINGSINTELPYGFYTIYFEENGLKVKIAEVFVDSNVNVRTEFSGRAKITILTDGSKNISLSNSSGTIEPYKILDNRIIYSLSPGIYSVAIDNETYDIIVLEDSVLDLRETPIGERYTLSIEVYDESGSPVNEYYVTFKDVDGRIIRSDYSRSYKSSYILDEGVYEVVISNGYIFSSKTVSLNDDMNISFRLPLLGKKVAERFLKNGYNVESLSSVDVVNLAMESYVGITVSFYLILPVVLLLLTSLSLIYINRFFYVSNEYLLNSLRYFNYTSREMLIFILKSSLPIVVIASLVSLPIFLYIDGILKSLFHIFSLEAYGYELLSYLVLVVLNVFIWILSGLYTVKRLCRD